MKKFQFSLSALLDVRRLKEEIAQKNLLETKLVLQREMAALEALQQEYHAAQERIRKTQKKMRSPEPLARLYEYSDDIKKRIKAQQKLVEVAKSNVELKRKDVVYSMQQRKIIENLRDKKLSEWEAEFIDMERKTFDELSTMRYGRKKKLKI